MVKKKKPPDKYNCIKVPFDKIIKDNDTKDKIFDCVVRTNKITIKTYQLLRLWILDKYHKNETIPTITEDTIKIAQKYILEKSAGPKPKGNNLTIDRKMGRLGNVNDVKEILEKIFKST